MTDSTSTPENKTEPPFNEWTLEGFLDEIKKINHTMEDRSFAFILGAGASVTSGIPAGSFFAKKWMEELYQRQCLDKSIPLEAWVKGKIHPELDTKNPAVHYPKIFEKRFEGDWQSGYASLEDAMEEAQPGLGYSLLAQILDQTRHKVIVTTNFDNLVANALAIHANKQPLVVGHEGLSGFVRPNRKRPLIAKIHRDLYFAPKNDSNGVDTLEKGWHEALQRLFSHYTPIVIGYGGNDGSLMNFLNNENLQIPGRIFWCYRGEDRPTNPLILDTVARHNGVFVSIDGFDELMLQLSATLLENFNYHAFVNKIEEVGKNRANQHRISADETLIELADRVKKNPTTKNKQAWSNILQILHDDQFALSWYLQGSIQNDTDKANQLYIKALELDPKNPVFVGNHANFLASRKKDPIEAEKMYKKSMDINPNHANNIGNYAFFLETQKKDYTQAENLYEKAMKIDPDHINNTINYAVFLSYKKINHTRAEQLYLKAMTLAPKNANNIGNYALFLEKQQRDISEIEEIYQKALNLEPNHETILRNYANFLIDKNKDYNQAKLMYEKAMSIEPENKNIKENYRKLLAKWCLKLMRNNLSKNAFEIRNNINEIIKILKKDEEKMYAEAFFYRSLLDEILKNSPQESLSKLKFTLKQEYEREPLNLSEIYEITLPLITKNKHPIYKALGAAILDEAKVADLDAFNEWVQLPAVSPFESV